MKQHQPSVPVSAIHPPVVTWLVAWIHRPSNKSECVAGFWRNGDDAGDDVAAAVVAVVV